jgi:hypothetical protein
LQWRIKKEKNEMKPRISRSSSMMIGKKLGALVEKGKSYRVSLR